MRDYGRPVRDRVGVKVRELRRQKGISQEKLAEITGSTSRHIGQIERAEVNVSINSLARLAAKLSVDIVELFGPTKAGGQRLHTLPKRELEQLKRALRTAVEILERIGG